MIVCGNHQARDADFHCSRCEAAFCRDCITIKDFGRSKIEVCPLCQNPITNLDPYRMTPPIWERVPQILTYPLSDKEWYFNFLGWGVFALVLNGLAHLGMSMGWIVGFVGGAILKLIYFSMLISYFYRIISRSEEGRFDVPGFTEFQGLGRSLVAPVIQYYLTILLMFWPIFLYFLICIVRNAIEPGFMFWEALVSPLALFIYLVGALYGLFFTPMGLLILGLTRDFNKLVNPVYIVRQVMKIPKEYLLTLAIIAGFLVAYTIVYWLINLILVTIGPLFYIVRFFVDGVSQLYMFMVIAHLLGYLGFQARFKLKWWPETQQEPVFKVAGRPVKMSHRRGLLAGMAGAGAASIGLAAAASQRRPAADSGPMPAGASIPPGAPPAGEQLDHHEQARLISEAMSMIDHGRHDEAIQIFQDLLDQNPRNLSALRGMTLAHLRKKEPEKAAAFASRQAAELVRDKAFEPVWEIYTMMSAHLQDFVIETRDQVQLARWLTEQNLHMEAARLLRALAVKRPDDPIAPKALFQCAELLWKKCGKPENAAQLFNYILKRYPDSPLAASAREALTQLK